MTDLNKSTIPSSTSIANDNNPGVSPDTSALLALDSMQRNPEYDFNDAYPTSFVGPDIDEIFIDNIQGCDDADERA